MSASTESESRPGSGLRVGLAVLLVASIGAGVFGLATRSRGRDAERATTVASAPAEHEPAAPSAGEHPRRLTTLPVAPPSEVPSAAAGTAATEQPSPPQTALEHRDRSVAELRASGPARPAMAASATKVATAWSEKMAKVGVVGEVGRTECYQKGCFVSIVHKSDADADRGMQAITRTGEFHGWQSGKMRSGPIVQPDGKVEVTWFLFTPDGGKEPLAATLPPDNLDELQQAPAP